MGDNLPELRDIHLPDGVSMWPPAYGWWVILAAIIGVILLLKIIKILRQKSKKLYALRVLKAINEQNNVLAALKVSEILRRICVYKYKQAVVLMGQDWLDFLNQHCKEKISGKAAKLLLDAPYMSPSSNTYDNEDFKKLVEFCQAWIGENL